MRKFMAGLLFATFAVFADVRTTTTTDQGGQLTNSIYVEKNGLVHGRPGDSYGTVCPKYYGGNAQWNAVDTRRGVKTKTCAGTTGKDGLCGEEQCGTVRRKCVDVDSQGREVWQFVQASNDCQPIRWREWDQASPWSNWRCKNGIEWKCRSRGCVCKEKKPDPDRCYNHFKIPANRRDNADPNLDWTDRKCTEADLSQNMQVCHKLDRDGEIIKNSQLQCQSRHKECFCPATTHEHCPHCGTQWPRAPPSDRLYEASCGCGYKGKLTRKCSWNTADKCSCGWEKPVDGCRKIEWGDIIWDGNCADAFKRGTGKSEPPCKTDTNSYYRRGQANCGAGFDLEDCLAAARLGCIPPRPTAEELCKERRNCECIESTRLFMDPEAGGRKLEYDASSQRTYNTYSTQREKTQTTQPEQITQTTRTDDSAGKDQASSKRTSTKRTSTKRNNRRKVESKRAGKGSSWYNNLKDGIKNIFKGQKKRGRRGRRRKTRARRNE